LVSDKKEFRSGVRQMTYNEEGGILKIWVNGRRFIGRGGNWGFPESNLCYRAREYDIAVRYHSDMNFTMIRNWVGQTGDEEFYEACDRHGVMVWQDFWLANPADGPDPYDNKMFLQNARDYILKIRNHPSIGIYVGRNEGYPPREIDSTIRVMLPELHPGLHYISNSAWDVVSGGGFYRAMPVKTYFKERATPKFHSEMGMPNIVTYESLQLMMPDSAIWPMKRMWGMHDFTLESAQYGNSFIQMIEEGFGKTDNIKDWVNFAQFINYQGYRAMFEAQSKNRMGLLLWMSHSAWPSLVWQTYDWYFEPTAAYFGCKKANEPIHIQWNMLTDTIEVVNYSAGDLAGLTAEVRILNLDGSVKWEKTVTIDSPEDSMVPCFEMEYPEGLDSTHFLKMELLRENDVLSENFYWRGLQEYNYKALRTLPKVKLETTTQVKREGEKWYLTTSLYNTSGHPAIMIRLKVIREKAGDRILPVIYSDNYVSLMPGEQRTILIELEDADARGEKPAVVVEGFNIQE
jgi:beta-galactosidase/beta-glucuronidase